MLHAYSNALKLVLLLCKQSSVSKLQVKRNASHVIAIAGRLQSCLTHQLFPGGSSYNLLYITGAGFPVAVSVHDQS